MGPLRPAAYQLIGLTKLLRNGQNAILIADGVGVGKTIAAGYIVSYLTKLTRRPALIVCPPGLVEKWRLELRSKFGISGIPIRSEEERDNAMEWWGRPLETGRQALILPSSMLARLAIEPFSGPVVIDEVHNYRNSDTELWQAAKRLLAQSSHRIGLSATPINNRIEDLANELALLLRLEAPVAAALLLDLWRPGQRHFLDPILTRFMKDRLGIHFAERSVSEVRVSLPPEYVRHALAAIKERRARMPSASIFLDEVTYFRMAASSAAALGGALGERFDDSRAKEVALSAVLGRHAGEPVIIFCEFEATAHAVTDAVTGRPSFLMTGSVPVFQRELILEQFRRSHEGVLVMTSVGAEGLDLQFASVVINYDLSWNPMVLEQRIGRVDRIGQRKAVVEVYNFVVEGSIDERVLRVLARKLGLVAGSVLEPPPVLEYAEDLLGRSKAERTALLSEEGLSQELAQAESLAKAIGLSGELLPQRDYEVLGHLREEFCATSRLEEEAAQGRLGWLSDSAKSWMEELERRGEVLGARIAYYS